MDSPFGVDHGEISKISWPQSQRKKNQIAAQQATRARRAAKLRKITAAPGRAANAKVSIADVGTSAGKGATALGNAVGKKPGLTGAALITGGGYAAYRGMQRDELPKRKQRTAPKGM